jgi:signal transduction histidine kinase
MAHLAASPLIPALTVAGWAPPTIAIGAALTSILLASVVWYWRERRVSRLRGTIGQIYELSEQILASVAAANLQRKLETELGLVLNTSTAVIYVRDADGGAASLGLAAARCLAPGPAASSAGQSPALRCLTSGEATSGVEPGPPAQPVVCYPMFAQGDLAGVLQLGFEKATPPLPRDASTALQHLANQAAITLKLLDQQLLREQVLRGEKLGAAGQLISGVAQELSVPLESIAQRARALLAAAPETSRGGLEALVTETGRAAETLSRLVSFTRGERAKARPVGLTALLAGLAEFRAQQWRVRSIAASVVPSPDETFVVGAQGQLEQAFLSLLLHAEQSLEQAERRELMAAVRSRAGRALVEIVYSAPYRAGGATLAEEGAWGLDVCRGIFANHGGSLHFGEAPSGSRFEVELPLAQPGTLPAAGRSSFTPGAPLTILLAEPDTHFHRYLLGMLDARHHRVVPGANAADVLDRVQRLRFDLLIASASLPGLGWVELVERARRFVPRFLILTDPLEAGAPACADPAVSILPRTCSEEDLDKVFAATPPVAPAS